MPAHYNKFVEDPLWSPSMTNAEKKIEWGYSLGFVKGPPYWALIVGESTPSARPAPTSDLENPRKHFVMVSQATV